MKKVRALLLCLFFVSFVSIESKATVWEQAGSFPYQISAMCFTSPLNGFVGTGTTPGDMPAEAFIYYTLDGGKSWTQSITPRGYAAVTDIKMNADNSGWASVGGGRVTLWKTVDAGKTWTEVESAKGTFAVGVYQTPSAIIVTDLFNDSRISSDNGLTFKRVRLNSIGDAMMGVDFVDDQYGVIPSYRNGGKWVRTTDGGRTWIETDQSIECWSVYGVKGTSTFFTAEEGNNNGSDYLTKIRRSTDYGATWNVVNELPFRSTGHITGINDILYIQTASDLCLSCYGYRTGIYRSTDKGTSWTSIGGPNNTADRRFTTVLNDCNTIIVYAADEFGNLFRLTDSVSSTKSDGMLYSAHPVSEPPVNAVSGRRYDVNIAAVFPPAMRIDTITAQKIALTVSYDSPFIQIDKRSGSYNFISPPGWKTINVAADSTYAVILIENIAHKPISTEQELGILTINVQDGSQHTGMIRLQDITIYGECLTYTFACQGEDDLLRRFTLAENDVRSQLMYFEKISIYPNPASVQLTVDAGSLPDQDSRIIVRDILGNDVMNLRLVSAQQQIDLTPLSNGSYYVSVVTPRSTTTKRIEIIR
jgi:photosystem II stability/assembly factor-like uncharacterized protein